MRPIRLLVLLAVIAAACTDAPSGNTTMPGADAEPAGTTAATAATPTTGVTTTAASVTTTTPCEVEPFAHSLVDLDGVEYITPLGLMIGSHVTPIDHIYFQNFLEPDLWIDVFAPADGVVTGMQHFSEVLDDERQPIDDYRLVIDHGCGIQSILIHIDELSPSLAAVAPPPGAYSSTSVPVTAGEPIGRFTANLDLTVVDESVRIDGLILDATYAAEPWKVHTPDPFDYFAPAIRERMAMLSLRDSEPYAGRFAWDRDGFLVGNWFLEGSGGYGGSDPHRYWAGHLSFAYDHLDHGTVILSIGTYEGRSEQFSVLGNGPDPATVTPATGIVTYPLTRPDYFVGDARWDRLTHADGIEARPGTDVMGTVLVEMLDDRTLLFEAFPWQEPDEVDGFTDAAQRFTR